MRGRKTSEVCVWCHGGNTWKWTYWWTTEKLFSSTVFCVFAGEEGKSIDFTLFIHKGLRESWSQCLTNFAKENVEKERIWNEKSSRPDAYSLKIYSKYSKWMLCYANFNNRTTSITSMTWIMTHKTILATLSKHAKTSNASFKSIIEAIHIICH